LYFREKFIQDFVLGGKNALGKVILGKGNLGLCWLEKAHGGKKISGLCWWWEECSGKSAFWKSENGKNSWCRVSSMLKKKKRCLISFINVRRLTILSERLLYVVRIRLAS